MDAPHSATTVPATVQVEQAIAASPESLYEMVSDVTSMGSWSPETTVCRWLGGATGPVLGARFKGTNRNGWRRWRTTCTVVSADSGRRFAFDVDYGPLPVARWAYDFFPDGAGCRVVETWTDRRQGWMIKVSPVVMGVSDRVGHNRESMTTTLSRLRAAAEHES
jgi:Polyketide cyclase / dehydrase and lipid transport